MTPYAKECEPPADLDVAKHLPMLSLLLSTADAITRQSPAKPVFLGGLFVVPCWS